MTDTTRVSLPAQSGPTVLPGLPGPPAAPAVHTVAVEHQGNFAHAICGQCGWRGPARRALSSAQDDAEAHTLLG